MNILAAMGWPEAMLGIAAIAAVTFLVAFALGARSRLLDTLMSNERRVSALEHDSQSLKYRLGQLEDKQGKKP